MTYSRVINPVLGMTVFIYYQPDTQRLSFQGRSSISSGQNWEELLKREPLFTKTEVNILYNVWQRWHLNDLRAGTPKQEAEIRKYKAAAGRYEYKEACDWLEKANLLVDNGYRYGTAWLKEEVPKYILKWLFSLPGTGHDYEDISPVEIDDKAFLAILNS